MKERDLGSSETNHSFIKKAPRARVPNPSIDLVFYRYMLDVYSVKVLPMINDFRLGRVDFAPKVRQFQETLSVVMSSREPEGCFWHLVGREQG